MVKRTNRPTRALPSRSHPLPKPVHYNIPVDMYFVIIKHLSVSDLAGCLRASRDLYQAVLPTLYRDIAIDLAKDANPLLVLRNPMAASDSDWDSYLRALTLREKEDVQKKKSVADRKKKEREVKREKEKKRKEDMGSLAAETSNQLSPTLPQSSLSTIDPPKHLYLTMNFVTHLTLTSHPLERC
jgi:hypothetical protein